VDAVALGLAMGLAAGVSPGPLLFLVLVVTLRSGLRAGIATAVAPLASDAIVIAGTLLVLSHVPGWVLPAMGVLGGGYVVWLAVETWRGARSELDDAPAATTSSAGALRKAVTVNLLSPHPWITWATVLGPLVLTQARTHLALAVLLVAAFYVALVGSKVLLAVLVARGRRFVAGRAYLWTMRVAAVLLVVLGLLLMAECAAQLVALWG
jgi:threonine/homoserine/homoserine lactone efflux protein